MRNSHRDGRKNGKLEKCYLGPYTITECLGKGVYKLSSTKTGEHCVFSYIVVCRIFCTGDEFNYNTTLFWKQLNWIRSIYDKNMV